MSAHKPNIAWITCPIAIWLYTVDMVCNRTFGKSTMLPNVLDFFWCPPDCSTARFLNQFNFEFCCALGANGGVHFVTPGRAELGFCLES